MKLTEIRLGDYIENSEHKNINGIYKKKNLRGIANSKQFIASIAKVDNKALENYYIVNPNYFAYVATTSRNGDKISIAYNNTNDTYVVSSSYIVFYITDTNVILPEFLYMFFNRPEFDRYSRFHSWGTTREVFSWEDMCNIKIDLPDIEIQRKYVNIYKSMCENQKAYEKGLDDLKLTCDAYIEDLRRKYPCEKIGPYLEEVEEKNSDLLFIENDVLGVSQTKEIIVTKAKLSKNDLSKFTIIHKNDFVYNPRNGIAIGLNKKDAIISFNNTAFHIKHSFIDKIKPEFIFMYFCRNEWDRKVKYDSWGTSTEIYSLCDLFKTKIPIPDIKIQESIVKVYNAYLKRKEINEKLKVQIKNICPILIRGATEEAQRS